MRTIDGYVFIRAKSDKDFADFIYGAVKEHHAKNMPAGRLYENLESSNLTTYRTKKDAKDGMKQFREVTHKSKMTLAHLVMKLAETQEECESFVDEKSLIFVSVPGKNDPDADKFFLYGRRVKGISAGFDSRCELIHNGFQPYITQRYKDTDYSVPEPKTIIKTNTAYQDAEWAASEYQRQGCGPATLATFRLRMVR